MVGSLVSNRAGVAILSIILGVLFAWLIAPFVFTHLPHDRAQIGIVVKRMREKPRLAVIGNSVAMYGVQLHANLASPGQMIAESVMIASELRDTPAIILVVTPWQLATPSTPNYEGWNAWWMYGLRPSAETRSLAGMPDTTDAEERFRSRWAVRASFESAFARGKTNDEVWQGSEQFAVDPRQRGLIEAVAKRRNIIVVLAPLSPIVRAHYGDAFKSVRFANTRTIDASELLQQHELRDATHPTPAGAQKLTRFIEEQLY